MSYDHLRRLLTQKSDISKWRQRDKFKIEFCDVKDVTTIPKGSTE